MGPQQDEKMTLVHDDYVFHYIVENGICYMCMSDEKNKHRIPFAFLEDTKNRFLAQFGLENAQQAIAFAMNEDFKGTLADGWNTSIRTKPTGRSTTSAP